MNVNNVSLQLKYFSISQNGATHILSDRTPLNWKEILIYITSIFLLSILVTNWIIGLVIGLLSGIGYTLFRIAASMYYAEIQIDTETGKMSYIRKLRNEVKSTELITDKYDSLNFEFVEIKRSGKTKFSLNYRTHKIHELLIVKSVSDKNKIENYIKNAIPLKP